MAGFARATRVARVELGHGQQVRKDWSNGPFSLASAKGGIEGPGIGLAESGHA